MNKCLYCYQVLHNADEDYHEACSKKFFGFYPPPLLPYTEDSIAKLALQLVKTHTTITGVQEKLSLHISQSEGKNEIKKFTIVGLWGGYILKPPTKLYAQLPEVEDLTMHLAAAAKIKVVPHSLIRLQSGNLAYITKRIDRSKKAKLHMEDMCQLTERLTEDKYRGSCEQIGKAIVKFSANPGLDLVNYCEQLLFCFLTGNADMHLKNFSLIQSAKNEMTLSPAYDLVNTSLILPTDIEEVALTLNAKKAKIKKKDFDVAFTTMGLDEKQNENIFKKMENVKQKWFTLIGDSFLSEQMKVGYKNIVVERYNRIFGKFLQ